MSHVVAADHDDEVAIARGASWELAPTPRVGPARKTSCRTCLWSLIALDGLPERASEAKIAFAQLFSLLNFRAGVVGPCAHAPADAMLVPKGRGRVLVVLVVLTQQVLDQHARALRMHAGVAELGDVHRHDCDRC